MSCLKLHWPQSLSLYAPADAGWQSDSDSEDSAVILRFPRRAAPHRPTSQRELLNRARVLYENRCCPECQRAAVVPVDAEPAVAYRDSMAVPGGSLLIGFSCDCCGHEWQA